jgi:hypothetical protein
MSKSYSRLIRIPEFHERLLYLQSAQKVGDPTFGSQRYLNQELYRSGQWRHVRDLAIVRDGGYDLAYEGYEVVGKLFVHHINPLTPEDIEDWSDACFDLENLITCSHQTHNQIHYNDTREVSYEPTVRQPGDTKLWS